MAEKNGIVKRAFKIKMDDFEHEQVEFFFKKLLKRPLIRIVNRITDEKKINPNFNVIQEKIDNNDYLTVMDFAIDVRTVFERARFADHENEVSDLSIIQLESWFEKQVNKIPRTKEEAIYNQMNKIKKQIELFRMAMSMSAVKIRPPPEQPVVDEGRKIPSAALIAELQTLIKEEMTTIDTQMKVASMIRKYIPNFDPIPTVRLSANLINTDLAEEIRDYLLKVKKERLDSLKNENKESTENKENSDSTESNEPNESKL